MNIWLITSGEIIPWTNERSCKTGILADMLIQAGHTVTWWSTTFDHQYKRFMYQDHAEKVLPNGVGLVFLHSKTGYRKNVSLQRIRNHKQVADSFRIIALKREKPDLIYCSFPTIDLGYESVRYGEKMGVPVVVDVRDLWPDLFFQPFPKGFHPFIRLALRKYISKTNYIFNRCTAITAISEGYMDWAFTYCKRPRKASDRIFPLGYDRAEVSVENTEGYAAEMAEKGLDASKLIVWFVGTFGQTYDLSTVIKVARALQSKGRQDIQFVLTGDGEMMGAWSSLAAGLDNVVFTGWVGKGLLQYLSSVADIGLMAYNSRATQGLPNKLFEYMSGGLPILSSLKGETQAVLEKTAAGLTYTADDAVELLNQIVRLADDEPLRKQMGRNGIDVFEKEYASEIVYANLVEYIENEAIKKLI